MTYTQALVLLFLLTHSCCSGLSVALRSSLKSAMGGPHVLALGSTGVDYIASVAAYPTADSKIRSESLLITGGGNSGNCITAVSRLGVSAAICSKVGADSNGRTVAEELERDEVDVSHLLLSPNTPTPFTYIVVDQTKNTRTCIHTPQEEELLPSEMSKSLLEGVSCLVLCGRHTEAAITLATMANTMQVPVVLDAEKDRPHFKKLLALADVVVCNEGYAKTLLSTPGWPEGGEASFQPPPECPENDGEAREKGMAHLLLRRKGREQSRAKLVISTLGEKGSVMMYDKSREQEVATLFGGLGLLGGSEDAHSEALPAACPVLLTQEVREGGDRDSGDGKLNIVRCPAWRVPDDEIVDTTGAGDAFIGGLVYSLVNKTGVARGLVLASLVAAQKLRQPGPRKGLPTAQDIAALGHAYLL